MNNIYIHPEDGAAGPYDPDQIRQRITTGELTWSTQGAYTPDGPWMPLSQLTDFRRPAAAPDFRPHVSPRRINPRLILWPLFALVILALWFATYTGPGGDMPRQLIGFALGAVAVVGGLILYILPSIVAHRRRHHNFLAIVTLNVLLGWTIIGWVIALVWSCSTSRPSSSSDPATAAL